MSVFAAGKYAEAEDAYVALLKGELSPDDRRRVKLYLALALVERQKKAQAAAIFREVLGQDADLTLPAEASPAAIALLTETRELISRPELEHYPPAVIDAAKGADLDVTIHRMKPNFVARLNYSTDGGKVYQQAELSPRWDEEYLVTLPPSVLLRDDAYALRYFIDVKSEDGKSLARLKSPEDPFAVNVSVPRVERATPVYKQWWFWTIIGGVVVGATAGGIAGGVISQQQNTGTAVLKISR